MPESKTSTSAVTATAVTEIRHGVGSVKDSGGTKSTPAGEKVSKADFTDEQWQELIDAGAIDVGQVPSDEEAKETRDQGGTPSPPPKA